MKFNEIKMNVESFFDNPTPFINDDQLKTIKSGSDLMISDVLKMINNEKLEQTNDQFKDVLDSMMFIGNLVLEAPLYDDFCKFVSSYVELSFNWNANTFQDEILRQMSLYIGRTIESRNIMMKSIGIVKDVDERMRDLSSWTPPAYEVAADYFEKLIEKHEKE